MWCPACTSEKTKVVGTDKSAVVERYRKCENCGHTFATIEAIKHDPTWKENAAYSDEEVARILKKSNSTQRDLFND